MAENLRILVSETQRSVRTSHHVNGKECGVDGGKKIKGKKEHIVVDTLGLAYGNGDPSGKYP